ncbi:MAG TPA: NIPSNAP family protein [Thermomicrobiales bacterium]|nr:NIPSNAP family protein [Thermomicrobiales bacterium]
MIYELRTYTAAPGKLDALNRRFRDVTLGLFEKHDLRVIGFWQPLAGDDQEGDLVYLLAHPDREAAEANWAAFRADEAWVRAKAESERDGPLTAKIVSRMLEPTDYSPLQ